jgi:chorismate synthase
VGPLVVRTAFKPLSTLMSPLQSVDIESKAETKGNIERSDVVAIPAAAVITESVGRVRRRAGVPRQVRRRLARRDPAATSTGYLEHVRSF